MMKKMAYAFLMCCVCAAVACAAPRAKMIRIGSASMGGNVYILGNGMAQLINQKIDGYQGVNQETNGSAADIVFLDTEEVELGIVMGATLQAAVDGTGAFKDGKVSGLAHLGLIKFDTYHVYVYDGSGIKSIPELRGRKIGVGPMGGGVQVNANALLKEYGIGPKDYTPIFGTVGDLYEQLKNGQIDALIHCASVGTSQPADALATGKVRLLNIEDDGAEKVLAANKTFGRYTIKANTYKNQPEDVKTLASTNTVISRADLDAEFVYKFVKAFYENKEFLSTFHKLFLAYEPENARMGEVVPMHPGAERYLKEIGALK